MSSSVPLVALFITKDLKANISVPGLYVLVTSLAGLTMRVTTGRLSDRLPSRLPLIRASALCVTCGWTLISLSTSTWMVIIVGAIFFGLGSLLTAQLFAVLRDIMDRDNEVKDGTISAIIRAFFSIGWILGPVLGSSLAAVISFRATFLVAAFLNLCTLVPLRALRVPITKSISENNDRRTSSFYLTLFAVICALVMSGDIIKSIYLSIYVVNGLKQSLAVFGTIVAIGPIAEVVMLPVAGILADRVGLGRIMSSGLLVAVAEYILLAKSTEVWELYLTQVMHAWVIAVILGLGVTYAQRLTPGKPGLASSMFFSGQSLAAIVGSATGSILVKTLGVPSIFFVPGAICAGAWCIFVLLDHSSVLRLIRLQSKEASRET